MIPITPRQAALTALAARGLGCKEIARELGIAVNTARVTLQQARERTGCRNVAHLVAVALTHGWIKLALILSLSLSMAADFSGDQLRNHARLRLQRSHQQVRREV